MKTGLIHSLKTRFAAAALALLPALAAAQIASLDDAELSQVTGREGIAIAIEAWINADVNANPVGTGCVSSGGNYTDGVAEACRLAIGLNNRAGEWLVLKDWFGKISIPVVQLDASCTSGTLGVGGCTGGTSTTNYDNLSRFNDQSGNCLINPHAGTCVAADVNNLPALQFSAPGNGTTFENDILWKFNVGGVSVEYDSGGTPGYARDVNGSFLGVRMSDTAQAQGMARFDIDGTFKLIGF